MYNFTIGVVDTDSISFCKPDGGEFSPEEIDSLIKELNDISPEFMDWADDGYYKRCLALKAKNYVLWDGSKKTIKGSALKDGKKEPALREMLQECVDAFLNDTPENVGEIYKRYVREAYTIDNISRWTVKKTITKPVLTNDRTNERKIREAVAGQVVAEGDKIWVYTAISGEVQAMAKGELVCYADGSPKMIPNVILKRPELWSGDEDKEHYVGRVYDTLSIFGNLLDMQVHLNYSLKRNKKALEELVYG